MEDSKKIIWEERKRNCLGLPWTFTKYAFSEDRIFVKSGLLKTVENEVRLYRVMDLSLTRTLAQKIFGLGTIKVSSADKTLGNFEIINISTIMLCLQLPFHILVKNIQIYIAIQLAHDVTNRQTHAFW